MPKNCQTWRLWYLYLDGICASMEVQCQCFKPRDHEALSHERTMNLMRFGSVVVNRLICLGPWRLSQCLLGCGWRICSCINEHLWTFSGIGDACSWRYIAPAVQQIVKRKIIPIILQKRKKHLNGRDIGAFSMFHFLFISKWYQRTFLTCFQFYYVLLSQFFFFFLVITVIISVNECVGSVCKWCIIDMCGWECFVVSIQSHNPNPTTEKIIITHKIKNLPWGKSGRLFCWTKNYWKGKILNT